MADDRIDEDHCRQLTAGEDIVADADLVGHQSLMHAGVNALVMAADEH